jgi:hypothetical protein
LGGFWEGRTFPERLGRSFSVNAGLGGKVCDMAVRILDIVDDRRKLRQSYE